MVKVIFAAILLAVLTLQIQSNMTIAELETAVGDLGVQLQKALDEIMAEIQNLENVPQSLVDKLDRAKAIAQALDDLNPDTAPKA